MKDIAEVIPLEKGRKITASQLLERFLFPPKQQYTYVSKLSGGEKKRLYLLTILMSNPNFLILDEPTNDLDIKTIQILEDFLQEFSGCLLVVSHDRAFMDHLANHIFYFHGEGLIKDYNQSFSEITELQKRKESSSSGNAAASKAELVAEQKSNPYESKLSYMERREYNKLEKEIEKLEIQKEQFANLLSDPNLAAEELMSKSEELGRLVQEIDEKTERWLELSERA